MPMTEQQKLRWSIYYKTLIDCDECGEIGVIVGDHTPRNLAADVFYEQGWRVKGKGADRVAICKKCAEKNKC